MTQGSESYLVGVDADQGSELMINIIKREEGGRLKVIKTLFGKEAEALYETMTKTSNDKK